MMTLVKLLAVALGLFGGVLLLGLIAVCFPGSDLPKNLYRDEDDPY